MGKLAEAYIDIKPDTSALGPGLGQVLGQLRGFVGTASTVMAGIGVAAAGVAAGVAIGKGLFEAARKASDLGETISKVKVTFGSAADSMFKQADDLAARFGVIKREALDGATSFGLMARAAGLSKETAAELGNEFVKLGLDAASYFNVSNEDAFIRIRSGLAGEAEPLRQFGVLLSEDAVKAEAVAIGLTKVKRELTEQEKVLARVSVIRKGLGVASGDLERTGDSAANQLRKLQGEIENATVSFGERLVPALSEGLKLAHELGSAFEKAFGVAPINAFGDAMSTSMTTLRVLAAEGEGLAGIMTRLATGQFSDAVDYAAKTFGDNAIQNKLNPATKPILTPDAEKRQKRAAYDAKVLQDAKMLMRQDTLGSALVKAIPDSEVNKEILRKGLAKNEGAITPELRARIAKRMQAEEDAETVERLKRQNRGPRTEAEKGAVTRDKANDILARGGSIAGGLLNFLAAPRRNAMGMLAGAAGPLAGISLPTANKTAPGGPSQLFGDIEDYIRAGIQSSIEKSGEKDDVPKKIDDTNKKLDEVKEAIGGVVKNIGDSLKQALSGGIPIQ